MGHRLAPAPPHRVTSRQLAEAAQDAAAADGTAYTRSWPFRNPQCSVHVAFESKGLKPGFHFSGPRVGTSWVNWIQIVPPRRRRGGDRWG
jgi:hypothetical protein